MSDTQALAELLLCAIDNLSDCSGPLGIEARQNEDGLAETSPHNYNNGRVDLEKRHGEDDLVDASPLHYNNGRVDAGNHENEDDLVDGRPLNSGLIDPENL